MLFKAIFCFLLLLELLLLVVLMVGFALLEGLGGSYYKGFIKTWVNLVFVYALGRVYFDTSGAWGEVVVEELRVHLYVAPRVTAGSGGKWKQQQQQPQKAANQTLLAGQQQFQKMEGRLFRAS
jgi:hypothetical protein